MSNIDWKAYYEAEEEAGIRELPDEKTRFRICFRLLQQGFESILDAGCAEGYWLEYLFKRVPAAKCVGIELAANRAERAKSRLPDLDVMQGDVTNLPFPDNSFDLVTCMEVLEHVPDWHAVLNELIRVARKTVLITVPYRQKLGYEICIHCHKPTPKAGHLHSFDEKSFTEVSTNYPLRFRRIVPIGHDLMHRLYYWLFRKYVWLAVVIQVSKPLS